MRLGRKRSKTLDPKMQLVEEIRERRKRRHQRRGSALAINLAPMIDVTFLLLIFFLVTTTFERAEGILASQMPREGAQSSVPLPMSPIVIRLDADPASQQGYALAVDGFDDAPTSVDELTTFLRSLHRLAGFDRQTPVVVVPDDRVDWDVVVGVWNAALRADCRSVAFAEAK